VSTQSEQPAPKAGHSTATQGPAFELAGAGRRFGAFEALQPLSLSIARGEKVALIGPSGAGKSTLLKLLNTSLSPSAGTVRVLGEEPAALGARPLRQLRARIGTIYQQLLLVPQASVFQNVVAGRLGRISLWRAAVSLVSKAEADRVAAVLDQVGIASKLYERVDRLSGGEQQRVAIARTLYQDPEIILADEPIASVDPAQSAEIVELLMELGRDRTIVMSTHRLEPVLPRFSRLIGLRRGRLLFDRAREQLSLEDLSRLYESERASRPTGARPVAPTSPAADPSSTGASTTLGASTTPGELILPELVAAFVKECPGTRVTLSVKDSAKVTEDLLEGRVELAFVGARVPHPELHFEDFAEDELVLVAAPFFTGLPPGPLEPSLAVRLPRVEREPGSGTRAVVEDHLANMGLELDPAAVALEVDSLPGLKAAVLSGVGVAFVSRLSVREDLRAGRLREVPVRGVKIHRRVFVAWRAGQELAPAARRFLEVARRTWSTRTEAA